jgi:hypothetical protein
MAEGLSSADLAGEISRHKAHSSGHGADHDGNDGDKVPRSHDRTLSIVEAVMLAIVALLAAYTGYASAKWSTESSVRLASASAARTEANRATLTAQNQRTFDSTDFDAWFTAYLANNPSAEAVAQRRFSPRMQVAFNAWIAQDPFTNTSAPPGPTYMPQYHQPELARAQMLDARASRYYKLGVEAGANSDNYVRDTIYLATVLFLIGISGHFRFIRIRLAMIGLGGAMMLIAIAQIAASPPIP